MKEKNGEKINEDEESDDVAKLVDHGMNVYVHTHVCACGNVLERTFSYVYIRKCMCDFICNCSYMHTYMKLSHLNVDFSYILFFVSGSLLTWSNCSAAARDLFRSPYM